MKLNIHLVERHNRLLGIVWRRSRKVSCHMLWLSHGYQRGLMHREKSIKSGIDLILEFNVPDGETATVYTLRGWDDALCPFTKISGAVGRTFKSFERWLKSIGAKGGAS